MIKTIFVIGISSLVAMPLWASNSHCKIDEKIIFSCLLKKNKKIVSICASNNFSAHDGYLQYRFGKKGKIELVLPVSESSSQAIQAKSLMFSGGGGGYLRFINEPYHYVVYSAIGRGWGQKDGVAIEKNQRLIAYSECKNVPISEMGGNFFSKSGLPIDTREFLLP